MTNGTTNGESSQERGSAAPSNDATLGLRWTRAIDPQKPKLRVVPLAELKAEAARRPR